jgi:hypothetical protein
MPKKSLVNLSLDSDFVDCLKEHAKAKNFEKLSEFVQDWLKKLSLDKKDIKRIILHVPEPAFNSKQALESWLYRRSLEIVNHYFKEE